jgi:subtilisin family serine protease
LYHVHDRVALKAVERSKVFDATVVPESANPTKRGQSGCQAEPCAGSDEDATSRRQTVRGRIEVRIIHFSSHFAFLKRFSLKLKSGEWEVLRRKPYGPVMLKARVLSLRALGVVLSLSLAACGGGGGGSSAPAVVPTTTPTTSPVNTSAYTCPASATSINAVGGGVTGAEATRRAAARPSRALASTTTQLAVTYDRSSARSAASAIAARERNAGAVLVQSFDFASSNSTIHVLAVPAAQVASATATLRAQSGVSDVSPVGRRHKTTVGAGYFPNDPYFNGFTAQQNAPAPATFHVAPYEESAAVPGQWDMHVIGLEQAWAYSQTGNGSSVPVNANALGSSAIKVAIIDTGVDPNHPELSSKISSQKCFITPPTGPQSSGRFSSDPDGHGTDVAGIAAAAANNGLGFVGVGGNVSIMAYRVFPTPDDNCANDANTDNQCSVNTTDIASAITDAVNAGANVISMSLGGTGCGTGAGFAPNGDSDVLEGKAVADAIAKNIIVVAAAGNDSSSPLEAPACDNGVIAVGASALADGQRNGAGNSNGSASAITEYVASYSDWGSPAASPKLASAWGIVAPGGDPAGTNDNDDLHWIEHIWTSTPFTSTPGDKSFTGNCGADYGAVSSAGDCRTLIAGTSMSTPHVAGAAALILSVNATYQSPTAMKALLCTTADDIADPHQGCGRLNVYRAMATALNDPHLP